MRIVVRIAGLAAAVGLVLWGVVIAIRSFEPQAGAGLSRLDGGAGLQALLGLALFVTAALVAVATFALARPACRSRQPFGLVVCLLGWAALAAAVASRAAQLFLAPVNLMSGDGPGVTSAVAHAWETYSWAVAALSAALAGALLVRWAVDDRSGVRVGRTAVRR